MHVSESLVARVADTVHGAKNDAELWDGWRTFGARWALKYLLGRIAAGVDRVGDARPEEGDPVCEAILAELAD